MGMSGTMAMEIPGPEGRSRGSSSKRRLDRHRHRHRRLTLLSVPTETRSGESIRRLRTGHQGQRVAAEVEMVVMEMTALEDEATMEAVRASPLRKGGQL